MSGGEGMFAFLTGAGIMFIVTLIVVNGQWEQGFCESKGMTYTTANTKDQEGMEQIICTNNKGQQYLFDSRYTIENKKSQADKIYCDGNIECFGKLK